MRNSMKLLPVLLLGSALGGCSMAGTGDFFADEYSKAQAWSQSGHYGGQQSQASCWQPDVVAQPQALQADCGQPNYIQPNFVPNVQQPAVAQPSYVQPNFAQAPYAQAPYSEPTYVQPQFQGAYVPPTPGVNTHGLRGRTGHFDKYAYGTLGGVAYEAGEGLYGLQGRLGYQFNRFFGAEAEGSFGVIDDTDQLTLASGAVVDQEIDINTSIAAFGVVRYPLLGRLSGLSRIGYHTTNVGVELRDGAGNQADTDFNTDGFAFGTGLEYAVDPRTAVRVDYTVYDFDGPDADALSLAVSRKF